MKKISIKLNKEFKSFQNGFTYNFGGDLIILSGINGSGKSQLLNIILGQEGNNSQNKISSIITIDDVIIEIKDIDYRSFKENIGISEITASTSQSFINSSQNAWKSYTRDRLNPLEQRNI